jgi:hypothetical protein
MIPETLSRRGCPAHVSARPWCPRGSESFAESSSGAPEPPRRPDPAFSPIFVEKSTKRCPASEAVLSNEHWGWHFTATLASNNTKTGQMEADDGQDANVKNCVFFFSSKKIDKRNVLGVFLFCMFCISFDSQLCTGCQTQKEKLDQTLKTTRATK